MVLPFMLSAIPHARRRPLDVRVSSSDPFLACLRLPYNLNSSNSYMRRQAQEWRALQYQQIMIWRVAKMDPKSWRELEKSTTPRTEVENGEVVLSCDRTLQP